MKFAVLLLVTLSCAAYIGSTAVLATQVSEHDLPFQLADYQRWRISIDMPFPIVDYETGRIAIDSSWNPLLLLKYGFAGVYNDQDQRIVRGWMVWYIIPRDWIMKPDPIHPDCSILYHRDSDEIMGQHVANYTPGAPDVKLVLLHDWKYTAAK